MISVVRDEAQKTFATGVDKGKKRAYLCSPKNKGNTERYIARA